MQAAFNLLSCFVGRFVLLLVASMGAAAEPEGAVMYEEFITERNTVFVNVYGRKVEIKWDEIYQSQSGAVYVVSGDFIFPMWTD